MHFLFAATYLDYGYYLYRLGAMKIAQHYWEKSGHAGAQVKVGSVPIVDCDVA